MTSATSGIDKNTICTATSFSPWGIRSYNVPDIIKYNCRLHDIVIRIREAQRNTTGAAIRTGIYTINTGARYNRHLCLVLQSCYGNTVGRSYRCEIGIDISDLAVCNDSINMSINHNTEVAIRIFNLQPFNYSSGVVKRDGGISITYNNTW